MPARLLSVAAALVLAGTSSLQAQSGAAFEVWTADQNANVLYVLDADGKVLRTLDSAALGNARRPHMLQGARGDAYVYIANTVSGSVTVLDRSDGAVKAVVSGVGKSPHAAQPNPAHPDRIYVMNIGPQALGPDGRPDRGETIAEVTRSGSPPAWRISRTIDLKAQPVLADSAKFPSRRPVYSGFSKDGRLMLVTLFNGGLAVVDLDEWKVTKAWGKRDIGQYGAFATMPEGNELYVTSGDMTSSWLYVIDVSGAEPQLVVRHDLSSRGQDAHGLHIDPVRRELWIAHRVSGTITIHPLATVRNAGHEIRVLSGFGKTPDMIAFSPDHSRAYVTLRGPKPAPTIPHATVGEAPGVAIIDVAGRRVMQVVKLGIQETGDFHGIFVPGSN
ncbi:MAG: hypothetical protein HY560_09675 [Gemmatimonadetes bacterium]|nr:hypothetical protein [Gemmatimonadota bacterium]